MTTRKVLTVGAIAHEAGLHPDTIRTYCRQGLLNPDRDSSGRRLFAEGDVKKAKRIAAQKSRRWQKKKEQTK